jgi:hypothetical protein
MERSAASAKKNRVGPENSHQPNDAEGPPRVGLPTCTPCRMSASGRFVAEVGRAAPDRSKGDQAWDNKVPVQHAPNSDRQPQRSRRPGDLRYRLIKPKRVEKLFLVVIEPPHQGLPRRESHHSDGINEPTSLQQTSATKSAQSGHRAPESQCPLLGGGVKRTLMGAAVMFGL